MHLKYAKTAQFCKAKRALNKRGHTGTKQNIFGTDSGFCVDCLDQTYKGDALSDDSDSDFEGSKAKKGELLSKGDKVDTSASLVGNKDEEDAKKEQQ